MPNPTVNDNEVALKIDMVTQMNQTLTLPIATNWPVKRVRAELSINHNHQMMRFPDIVLYSDPYGAATSIVQMWEVKCPDVSISDEAFIKDAQDKAISLNLSSTITWNFQFCKLWSYDGTDFNCIQTWELHPERVIRNRAEALEFVARYNAEWMALLNEVFLAVNQFIADGTIRPRAFIFSNIESYVSTLVMDNVPSVKESLLRKAQTDVHIDVYLEQWWISAKIEFENEFGNDKYGAYSKCIVLNWAIRILFANAIKNIHFPAAAVENITINISATTANSIFEQITTQCDFYNAFHSVPYNDCVGESAWGQICAFNSFVCNNGITGVTQENLQSILEWTVSATQREIIGQYTTPVKLARILARITIIDRTGVCIDPCCGSGTIPKAIIEYKKEAGIALNEIYRTTWGSDCNSFPLQMATIALTSSESVNIPLVVFKENVFDIAEGNSITITNPANGEPITYPVEKFDYILSNLPFVDFNTAQQEYQATYDDITNTIREKTGISLSGKSDMYCYILLYLWRLLKDNAKVGVIVSNSWLKSYYTGFFDALRNFYHVEQIAIASKERWFKNASVVTTLMVLQKKPEPFQNQEEVTRFEVLNKKLSDISNNDMTDIRNCALTGVSGPCLTCREYMQRDIDNYISCGLSLNSLFFDISWFNNYKDKACPLSDYFEVRRGLKSGYDKAFYVHDSEYIDEEYMVPMIKTGQNISSLVANPDSFVVVCDKNYDELNHLGHRKTMLWFRQHEADLLTNKTASINAERNRRQGLPWYSIGNIADFYVDLILPINNDKRFYCSRFAQPTVANQRLIFLKAKEGTDVELCHALLNSLLFVFSTEASGTPMGNGALDNNGETIRRQFMPNPTAISAANRQNILEKFQPLLQRDIYDINTELMQQDRIEFDHAVLQAYDIDCFYDHIVAAIKQMQEVRFSWRN